MKPVVLSADGEAMLCSVPDAVAEHLEDCCMAFCTHWLWESPEAERYRQTVNGITVVCYTEADFIGYLNTYAFPGQPSFLIEGLGCPFYEIPARYQNLPRFNF